MFGETIGVGIHDDPEDIVGKTFEFEFGTLYVTERNIRKDISRR
jgi:hypothetical protein